jgi:hypothetical protein
MIETVQEIDNMFFPVYANLEQERSTVRLASRSNEIFLSGLAQLKELDATELLMIVSTFEDRHVDYFYSILTGQYDALSKIRSQQMSENGPVARLLDEKKRLSSP